MNAKNIALASFVLATGCVGPGSSATVTRTADGFAQVIVCDRQGAFSGCDGTANLTVEQDGAVTQIPFANDWQGSMLTLPSTSTEPFTISDGHSAVEVVMPTPLVVDPTSQIEYPAGSTVHLTWAAANEKMTWSYSSMCEYAPNQYWSPASDETALPDNGALDVSVDSVMAQARKGAPQFDSCITTIWLSRKVDNKTDGSFLDSAVGASGLGVIVKMY